ncbi:MAG: flagellar basal body P-ring protein FlgI [Acidobacteria bacterium]|nr:flagellar basal body P-ring protein FlgI [Acidobacteriota bacterium]
MRRTWICWFLAFCWIGNFQSPLQAASRIKDIASFEGVRENQLVGYGLVVGLNGTGDRRQTLFPTQTLANMLERSGISISADQVNVKNIAAVMVTATLPPFVHSGSHVDVTVSSIGDAQSIQGGVLIMTPLLAANNEIYVTAQGQIALGGFSAGGSGNRVQTNHPTVGRIVNGGLVEKEVPTELNGKSKLNLVLNRNDFTTASRAVRAINETSGSGIASALDGRTISIRVPPDYGNRIVEFISMVENAQVEVDNAARVILNEKTGTIVLGKEVKISEVSIIHGSLSLQVGTTYQISQPEPFGKGETMVVPERNISVQEEKGRSVMLREGASVEEVVRALNAIGAGPRDVIAILQAIKAQGALHAELEII